MNPTVPIVAVVLLLNYPSNSLNQKDDSEAQPIVFKPNQETDKAGKQGVEEIVINRSFQDTLATTHPGLGSEWIPMNPSKNGSYVMGYVGDVNTSERMLDLFDTDPKDAVTFKLFTRQTPLGEFITLENIPPSYNTSKPTKFVTHGWMSDGETDTCMLIKTNYLEKEDLNVIIMDWRKISVNPVYTIPQRATYNVATYYAKLLDVLIDKGADPKQFHMIGHSLGAHISGFTARQAKKKIGRVTALDPAKPGFDNLFLFDNERVSKTDADFVDVIHTCAGLLGLDQNVGHADFYPNGGFPPQPGCDKIIEMTYGCSHQRSWEFFAESIRGTKPFRSYRCNTYENHRKCENEWIPMGDNTPTTANGIYLVRTYEIPPFADLRDGS